ncbi:hypothetical protein Tco_1225767, partial [Tanacetum coccineum]
MTVGIIRKLVIRSGKLLETLSSDRSEVTGEVGVFRQDYCTSGYEA